MAKAGYLKNYSKSAKRKAYIKSGMFNRIRRQHIAANAKPVWTDDEAIRAIYGSCPFGHHVDHIVPLKGDGVCGLHVHYNLQIIPAVDNLRKGNSHERP